MNTTQRIIKALAIALAVFIIFNIISAIITVMATISGIQNLSELLGNDKEAKINFEESFNVDEIKNLNIQSDVSKINIINSNDFKVQANNVTDKFKCEIENGTLVIKDENNKGIFNLNDNENSSLINIYVPEKIVFNIVEMEIGVGNSLIESLYANDVELSTGVGDIDINFLSVQNKLDIESGVGEITIKESYINNLQLDAGIGDYKFNSRIIGEAIIDSGIGNGTINLKEFDEDKSKIVVDKGIGKVKINNMNCSNEKIYGTGNNILKIDNGIGNIDITIE